MAGNSSATITFGVPVATNIMAGGTTAISTIYNISSSGGATACRITGGGTIVAIGKQTGTIQFNSNCAGLLTSDLVISLGNLTGITDANNASIVEPGKQSDSRITAPGAIGASTGNITY